MASLTMTASLLPAARPSSIDRRSFVSAKSATVCFSKAEVPVGRIQEPKEKESNTRRGLMLGAAVAIWVAGSVPEMEAAAVEEEEPKRGTLEAKKKYFQVCVTMPTASICHK